jgi:hypothetical protein
MGLILSGLRQSMYEPTENEKRLAVAVGETEWGKHATVTLGKHVNASNPDLWIAKSRMDNADATREEIEPILKEAYRRAISLPDSTDERKATYLIVQIRRLMSDRRVSRQTSALLYKVMEDFERIEDAGDALEQFRIAYLDPNVTEPIGDDTETTSKGTGISSYAPVTREQANPISRQKIEPSSPNNTPQTTPRDHPPTGLSENTALYEGLGKLCYGLDTEALRYLHAQARRLRGAEVS